MSEHATQARARRPGRRRLLALAVALATGGIGAGVPPTVAALAAQFTVSSKTMTIDGASVCTVTATADSYVDQLLSGSNFGTATTIAVKSASLANKRSFLKFDLSTCSIPGSATVRSGALKLYLSAAPTLSRTYEARRVTASWTETGVTWSAQPALAGAATGTTATGTTAGVTLEWNVTADVSSFVAGTATNHGWRVADQTESAVVAVEGTFASRQNATTARRPRLTVTYVS